MRKLREFPVFKYILALAFGLVGASLHAQDALKEQLKNFDREDIHSIHKKLYTKQGRHEVTVAAGGIMNHDGYFLGVAQYQYHFFESFGVEAVNGGFGFQTKDNNKLMFYQGGVTFSPLYGKLSLFTYAVWNYDIYVVGGAGFVRYSGLRSGTTGMGNIGLGYRFFINDWLSTKIEFRDYIYKLDIRSTTGTTSRIWNNYALTAGVSFMFPMRPKY